MTPFRLLLDLSGLSQREAAAFLDARPDTVVSWSSGRRTAPVGAVDEMAQLVEAQTQAAHNALEQIAQLIEGQDEGVKIEFGYPADDYEAQALGFPTPSAWGAMAARVVAKFPGRIRLVPRGSTPATAAAIEAHEGRAVSPAPY